MQTVALCWDALRRDWWLARLLPVCLALGLGACASPRVIDTEVHSFVGAQAPQTQRSFRLERLPSQQNNPPQAQAFQEQLEAWVSSALVHIGLTPDAQQPQYLVQASASVESVARAPWFSSGVTGAGMTGGFWSGFHQLPYGVGMSYFAQPPWTRYEVHILLRDAASGQAVYESAAQHLGPWSDTAWLLPAVVGAALQDYPSAVPNGHTVQVEVGPQGLPDRP